MRNKENIKEKRRKNLANTMSIKRWMVIFLYKESHKRRTVQQKGHQRDHSAMYFGGNAHLARNI